MPVTREAETTTINPSAPATAPARTSMVRRLLFSQGLGGVPRRLGLALRLAPQLVRYVLHRLSFRTTNRSAPHKLVAIGLRRDAPDCCGMLTDQERVYFYAFARRLFTGQGEIVDLGSWLGSTTISLAAGLRANRRPGVMNRKIHAYDRFTWESWMDVVGLRGNPPLTRKFRNEESFLDEFRERISTWKESVVVHPGDLRTLGWQGGPIEFLLVDAMKTWALANSIVHDFYPSLIPGCSVVIQQDFAFWGEPWIHLIHYRLRDYFEPLHHIQHSSSMAFGLRKKIPPELLQETYSYASFSDKETDAAIAYSAGLVSPHMRTDVLSVRALIWGHRGDALRARQFVDDFQARGIPLPAGIVNATTDAVKGLLPRT